MSANARRNTVNTGKDKLRKINFTHEVVLLSFYSEISISVRVTSCMSKPRYMIEVASLLGTPVQSNAIKYNCSAIRSTQMMPVMFFLLSFRITKIFEFS